MSSFLVTIGFLGLIISLVIILLKKKKRKNITKKLLFAPVIFFIMTFGGCTALMSSIVYPETISLAIPDYQEEYDINTTIPVEISIQPEDADTSSIEYVADDGITFTSDGIVTGETEGTFTIYVECKDVKSDSFTITVVDIAAQEQAAAEEAAAKQAAAEQAAAEQAAAEQAAAEQAAAEQAAAEQAAAEQAAAEQAAAEQAAAEATDSTQNDSTTVYWTPNGEVYHSTPDCPSLSRSKTIKSGTISQSGKSRACKNCY